MRKAKIWVVFLCVFMAFFAWIQAETEKDRDVSKKIDELQKKILKLEKRIKFLEKQLRSFDHKSFKIPHKTYPKLQKLPKGWKEQKYEGLTYYIVPLKNELKRK